MTHPAVLLHMTQQKWLSLMCFKCVVLYTLHAVSNHRFLPHGISGRSSPVPHVAKRVRSNQHHVSCVKRPFVQPAHDQLCVVLLTQTEHTPSKTFSSLAYIHLPSHSERFQSRGSRTLSPLATGEGITVYLAYSRLPCSYFASLRYRRSRGISAPYDTLPSSIFCSRERSALTDIIRMNRDSKAWNPPLWPCGNYRHWYSDLLK